jgi:hypothetical protein
VLVEEIVGCGIYAPTNNYTLRAIAVDDPAIIEALDAIIVKAVSRLYNLFFLSRWVFDVVRAITPALDAKLRVKMERGLERGQGYDTPPAAVVLVVGDRRIVLSEASAYYALNNMILCFRTKVHITIRASPA